MPNENSKPGEHYLPSDQDAVWEAQCACLGGRPDELLALLYTRNINIPQDGLRLLSAALRGYEEAKDSGWKKGYFASQSKIMPCVGITHTQPEDVLRQIVEMLLAGGMDIQNTDSKSDYIRGEIKDIKRLVCELSGKPMVPVGLFGELYNRIEPYNGMVWRPEDLHIPDKVIVPSIDGAWIFEANEYKSIMLKRAHEVDHAVREEMVYVNHDALYSVDCAHAPLAKGLMTPLHAGGRVVEPEIELK